MKMRPSLTRSPLEVRSSAFVKLVLGMSMLGVDPFTATALAFASSLVLADL